MLSLVSQTRVFVALAPVDLRLGFNGLSAYVQGVLQQEVLSGAHQAIDALPKIDRLDRQQNPHLGRDRNHKDRRQKAWANSRKTTASAEAMATVIWPPSVSCRQIRHSPDGADGGRWSSTKAGLRASGITVTAKRRLSAV